MWIDPNTLEVAHTHSAIRQMRPNWSAGQTITDADIADQGFIEIAQVFPNHDPLTQVASELPPALVNGVWVQQWEITNKPLPQIESERQQAIEARWAKIRAERDDVRSAGGVLVGGHWFHTDTKSRIQWLGLKDTARDMLATGGAPGDQIQVRGKALVWKTMAGAWAPVTVQLVLDVVQATKDLDGELHERAEIHNAQMMQAANPASYDYSTNWPARYVPGQPPED